MPRPVNKPVIAVDLDEVLAAQQEAIRLYINKTYKTNFTPEDYIVEAPYWSYWETVWGVDSEEGERRIEGFIKSGGLKDQKPIPGAIEAISELQKRFKLVVVTSRHDEHAEDTRAWLEKHYPRVFKGVLFTSAWGNKASVMKAKVCKDIGADYLIDDNFEHCKLVAEEGIKGLLFGELGWNMNKLLPKGVTRVKNWQEVLEFFANEKG
jgi:5'(3')-deoxyribonucleotidase